LYPSAFTPVFVSGGLDTATNTATVYGADVHTSSFAYVVQSQYPGTGYNLSTIANTGQTVGLSMEINSAGAKDFTVGINNDGVNAETFKVSIVNGTNFIEDIINVGVTNPTSDYIKGELMISGSLTKTFSPLINFTKQISTAGDPDDVGITLNSGSQVATANPRFVKLKDGTYSLSGGTNGTMGNDELIEAISVLDDDLLNISMAVVPGSNAQSVQNELITLAETSQNFLAVVSPPFGLANVEAATEWVNGRSTSRTAAINSSWASVYWPWVQVFDTFSGKDMWYDPAIFAIRQMAFTDNVAETWFAPAGFRRGRLTKPTATEIALNQGDRDALYTNNINPVVNFTPEGITIFGQKTAQRAATSLDRINVRRLMIYLRKVLLLTGRQDLFEPNDTFTWEIVKDKADALLSDIQARRGITDFRVVCDETVNTPLRVDRNELWCKILIKPTKTAEWIVFEVNLTNQSAKFSG
jgi:phage tail sheath protein FI